MLWQNEPSVVIGKYQNAFAEVNFPFAEKKHVKIVRRFSGGGAVYQDAGNLNLTFIENNTNVKFENYTHRILALLATLGIEAETDVRRAININGLKISGSAQCIHKDRVMYHATLLFSSDLSHLSDILNVDAPRQMPDKSDKKIYVKSVKSPVTNLSKHINASFDIDYLKDFILNYFLNENPDNRSYELTEKDITAIQTLANEKYATESWNLGGNNTLKNKNKLQLAE